MRGEYELFLWAPGFGTLTKKLEKMMDIFEKMSEEGIAAYFYSSWKKCFGKKDEDDDSTTDEDNNQEGYDP